MVAWSQQKNMLALALTCKNKVRWVFLVCQEWMLIIRE